MDESSSNFAQVDNAGVPGGNIFDQRQLQFLLLMEEAKTKRYAVVTGANKGIGFGVCKQLASHGIIVVLTARDVKRGLDAVEKLKEFGLSNHVVFHQLDVLDPASVVTLANFVKSRFGKLDILVNNAGVGGNIIDGDAFRAAISKGRFDEIDWSKILTETYELAEQCLKINYYGAKRTCEALIPLLQLSDSPKIVNVSSSLGILKNIPDGWAKGVLNDVENLEEERLDGLLTEFLKDFKEGSLETKRWPSHLSAYKISKACLNAYTRTLAKRHQSFRINCVCPGFVKTDLNQNVGILTIEEGAESVVRLALLPKNGPSGLYFKQKEESPF